VIPNAFPSNSHVMMIGIGELAASGDRVIEIKTMALGSCVSVILLDPKARVGGMVHVALPDSNLQVSRRVFKPGYFADTGIPALLAEMKKCGSSGVLGDMYIKLAGGAKVIKAEGALDIGHRNLEAIKQIMAAHRVRPVSHDVGGCISRTVSLEIKSGTVRLSCPGREDWFI